MAIQHHWSWPVGLTKSKPSRTCTTSQHISTAMHLKAPLYALLTGLAMANPEEGQPCQGGYDSTE